jgi:hypothetical protein
MPMMNDRKEFEAKEMFFDTQYNDVYRKEDVWRLHNCCSTLQVSVSVSTTNSVSFKQDFLNEGTPSQSKYETGSEL